MHVYTCIYVVLHTVGSDMPISQLRKTEASRYYVTWLSKLLQKHQSLGSGPAAALDAKDHIFEHHLALFPVLPSLSRESSVQFTRFT